MVIILSIPCEMPWISQRSAGVDELKSGDYRIPPDRIVAGTYLCAAAAARSKIILHNVPVEELQQVFFTV